MVQQPNYDLFLLLGIGFAISTIIRIFFLLTLQTTLKQVSLSNRTIKPAQLWLALIPFFELFWCFYMVTEISKSLKIEFQSREIPQLYFGRGIGIAWAISSVISTIIPYLGLITIILMIIYWSTIFSYGKILRNGLNRSEEYDLLDS